MIPWRKSAPSAGHPAPHAAKRVLVLQLGGIAEFVQALAPAKAIRDYHMGARITLLTNEALKPLAEKCPYFDLVETEAGWDAPNAATAVAGAIGGVIEPPKLVQTISRIRAGKYEMIYDLENSKRTQNLFSGLRPWPPLWSGSAQGASHAYLDPERERMHRLDRYAGQMQAAGIELRGELLPDLGWVRTALRDPPRLRPDYFGIRGRYVLLIPRGNENARERRWPEAKYIEIASRLARNNVTPVVLGGPEERAIGAAIVKAEPKAKNLVTRPDLFQCAALAEHAAFALGDDVDLMHVAAAAGAPCLVFLSSSLNPDRVAPRGKGGVVALTAAVIADLPVEQVDRQIRNCGVYRETTAA